MSARMNNYMSLSVCMCVCVHAFVCLCVCCACASMIVPCMHLHKYIILCERVHIRERVWVNSFISLRNV